MEHGSDAAVARMVRAAALRLGLAFAIAASTAVLSLAALSARTGDLVAAPIAPRAAAQPTGGDAGRASAESAAPALRTDI